MDPATIAALANAASVLVPLAAKALQEAVNNGTMTASDANSLWASAHGDWQTAYAAWQQQMAADKVTA